MRIENIRAIEGAQEYVCQLCDERFFCTDAADLVCPKCGARGEEYLLAIELSDEVGETP
jgi:rubrerythrin